MTVLEELEEHDPDRGRAHRPGGGRARAGLGPRLGVRDRPGPGPDQRPQPARRRGDGDLRRRPPRDRPGAGLRRRPRPRRDRGRHGRDRADRSGPRRTSSRCRSAARCSPWPTRAAAGLRVTPGFVSSTARSFRGPRGRRIAGAIEHTAPLPRGSSGGPLVDRAGRLLGINAVRADGGLILALPGRSGHRASASRRSAAARRPSGSGWASRSRRPAWPGACAARSACPSATGVLVRAVERGSAADRAGLERGDLIVAAGGRELDRVDVAVRGARRGAGAGRAARADDRPRHRGAHGHGQPVDRSSRDEHDGRATRGRGRRRREAEALDAYSRVVVDVAERLAPSVANLRVMRRGPGRPGAGRRRQRGRADPRRLPADLRARRRRARSRPAGPRSSTGAS